MKTLGYIEVQGLTNAIVTADKMLKTADVELKSIENTRGSGWVTVSIIGDVAAVGVSIATAKEMMKDSYVSSTVLANPAEGMDKLGKNDLLLNKENIVEEELTKKVDELKSQEKDSEPEANKVTKTKKQTKK